MTCSLIPTHVLLRREPAPPVVLKKTLPPRARREVCGVRSRNRTTTPLKMGLSMASKIFLGVRTVMHAGIKIMIQLKSSRTRDVLFRPALRGRRLDVLFPGVLSGFWTSIPRKKLLTTSKDTNMKFLEATRYASRAIRETRKACGS